MQQIAVKILTVFQKRMQLYTHESIQPLTYSTFNVVVYSADIDDFRDKTYFIGLCGSAAHAHTYVAGISVL